MRQALQDAKVPKRPKTETKSLGRFDGYMEANSDVCVVSFPVTLGQRIWDRLVLGRDGHFDDKPLFNSACVWMGRHCVDKKEWYEPWESNVREAIKEGMKLIVVKNHREPPGRYGEGQQHEISFLNENGFEYRVRELEGWEQSVEWLRLTRPPTAQEREMSDVLEVAKKKRSLLLGTSKAAKKEPTLVKRMLTKSESCQVCEHHCELPGFRHIPGWTGGWNDPVQALAAAAAKLTKTTAERQKGVASRAGGAG